MASPYTISDQFGQYFVTFTVHQWVDVFTRSIYSDIFLDSIRFCQREKGLRVYGWVIMTNHVHMIIDSIKEPLSDIIRDLKKFTSRQIYEAISSNPEESRKKWLMWLLRKDGKIWFWEEGYHGEEIVSANFYSIKLNYIHLNPVKAGIVEREEDYTYSSCADHSGIRKGLLDLQFE